MNDAFGTRRTRGRRMAGGGVIGSRTKQEKISPAISLRESVAGSTSPQK